MQEQDRNEIIAHLNQIKNNETSSEIRTKYLQGVFDTLQFIGGDLKNSVLKKNEITGELFPNKPANFLKQKQQVNVEHRKMQTELCTTQVELKEKDKILSDLKTKLSDKTTMLHSFQRELEQRNIMITKKNQELQCLQDELNTWKNVQQTTFTEKDKLIEELSNTRLQLEEKTKENKMIMKELEKRNIMLSLCMR